MTGTDECLQKKREEEREREQGRPNAFKRRETVRERENNDGDDQIRETIGQLNVSAELQQDRRCLERERIVI